jgi:23S rRNA pseudouridine1911/1915/1917 synthase
MNAAQRNSPPSETFVVSAEDLNVRLDHYLTARLPHLSRSRIQAVVKSGEVLLNGLPSKMGQKLRVGDEVVWHEPPPAVCETAEPSDIPLNILFEDKYLLVINKATGLVVHPGAGHRQGTLVSALLHHCGTLSQLGGTERPGIVHRLDRETSGCLVVAKNTRCTAISRRNSPGGR